MYRHANSRDVGVIGAAESASRNRRRRGIVAREALATGDDIERQYRAATVLVRRLRVPDLGVQRA